MRSVFLSTVIVLCSGLSCLVSAREIQSIDLGFHFDLYSFNEDGTLLAIAGPQKHIYDSRMKNYVTNKLEWQVVLIDVSDWSLKSRFNIDPIDDLLLVGENLILKEHLYQKPASGWSETKTLKVVNALTNAPVAERQVPKDLWRGRLNRWSTGPDRFCLRIASTVDDGPNWCLNVDDLSAEWQFDPRGGLGGRLFESDSYSMFDIYPDRDDQKKIAFKQSARFFFGELYQVNYGYIEDRELTAAARKWGRHESKTPFPSEYGTIVRAESVEFPVIVRLVVGSRRNDDEVRVDFHHRIDHTRFGFHDLWDSKENVETPEIYKRAGSKSKELFLNNDSAFVVLDQKIVRVPFPADFREQMRIPMRLDIPAVPVIDLNEVSEIAIGIVGEATNPIVELLKCDVPGLKCDVPGVTVKDRALVIDGPAILKAFDKEIETIISKWPDWSEEVFHSSKYIFYDLIDYEDVFPRPAIPYALPNEEFMKNYRYVTGTELPQDKTPFSFTIRLKVSENDSSDDQSITFIALMDWETMVKLVDRYNLRREEWRQESRDKWVK